MNGTPELLQLPHPIELYFASENTHTASATDKCFAADAIVRDEGKTIEGVAAIRAWRVETAKKYNHRVEPLEVSEREIIVKARVSGNFPGSPTILGHSFADRRRPDCLARDSLMANDPQLKGLHALVTGGTKGTALS
jgi:alpha-D-ribose 1-methylphosphonate 5-triphosphate synthase subunit PhnI